MALQITESKLGEAVVLELTGRVTLGEESMELRNKFKEVLSDGKWLREQWGWPVQVVLDMGKVTFVDSAGLGALVAVHAAARHDGATVKLANLAKLLRDLLSITKLATVFEVYDSVRAAVDSFPKFRPAGEARTDGLTSPPA